VSELTTIVVLLKEQPAGARTAERRRRRRVLSRQAAGSGVQCTGAGGSTAGMCAGEEAEGGGRAGRAADAATAAQLDRQAVEIAAG
jgi:hypothetical protein